jgi:hypothetical protein
MLNIITNQEQQGAAVLIRAAEPVTGISKLLLSGDASRVGYCPTFPSFLMWPSTIPLERLPMCLSLDQALDFLSGLL